MSNEGLLSISNTLCTNCGNPTLFSPAGRQRYCPKCGATSAALIESTAHQQSKGAMNVPKSGEEWYIKRPDLLDLRIMRVVSITEKVVHLEDFPKTTTRVYRLADIEFVEQYDGTEG